MEDTIRRTYGASWLRSCKSAFILCVIAVIFLLQTYCCEEPEGSVRWSGIPAHHQSETRERISTRLCWTIAIGVSIAALGTVALWRVGVL